MSRALVKLVTVTFASCVCLAWAIPGLLCQAQDTQLTLFGISPRVGPTGGGTLVIVKGTRFEKGAVLSSGYVPAKVGYQQASKVEVIDDTQITAVTPPHTQGVVDVIVTNRTGESATLVQAFEYK